MMGGILGQINCCDNPQILRACCSARFFFLHLHSKPVFLSSFTSVLQEPGLPCLVSDPLSSWGSVLASLHPAGRQAEKRYVRRPQLLARAPSPIASSWQMWSDQKEGI